MDKKLENNSKSNHIYSLDVLRVILCLMVLFFHAVGHKAWIVAKTSIFWHREFSAGALYMDGFFMLSGFVLYFLYSIKDFSNISILKDFYVKRFIRIYPIYIVHTIIWCIFYHKFNLIILPSILLGISAFYPPLFNKMGIGGTWFISVILFAYLLFPILVYLIKFFEKHIYKFLTFLYLLIIYTNIIGANWHINKFAIYINPVYRVLTFIVGMCIASIFIKNKEQESRFLNTKSCILFALLLIIVPVLYKNNFFNHVPFGKNWTYYSCVTIPLFGLLIYHLSKIKNGLFNVIGKNCVIQHFAKVSLCFYLAQSYSITVFKNYIKRSNSLSIFIIFILTYLFACILHYAFEKPATKYFTTIYNQYKQKLNQ